MAKVSQFSRGNSGQSGKLIVFEGVEGCGKTTQLLRLRDWLTESGWVQFLREQIQAEPVMVTREPGGTNLGLELRRLLLERGKETTIQERAELLLYAADRTQHVEELLKPNLLKGVVILCDRFTDSTIAYQGYGRGLNQSLISQLNNIATNGLESDLTVWLDLDVEIGLARKRKQGEITLMEEADLAFHHRVQQGFTELAKAHPQRIVKIDANQNQELIAEQIQKIVNERLTQWYNP
ncbi:dTMP kinase [Phormidium sp. LEGE 05292]|uniref:dTMP kinase n=1 Tax=[Phormidium] sp. LEGE 05292 TaxID=767427 RepID=UPI0018804BB0|nr:dTMP kinase [Phormidium sp. LEGE 05292]MBE9224224.1 dTMP kinase [Phormidium sp. LEGE 05292]